VKVAVKLAVALVAALATACYSTPPIVIAPLSTSRSALDRASYDLRRVGIVPFTGAQIDGEQSRMLQTAFALELARRGRFEVVQLAAEELAEVDQSQPHLRGAYDPRTLLELSHRYRLDGLVIGTVAELQWHPPLEIAVGVELVSCETGLIVWSSSVQIDTEDPHARKAMEAWCEAERSAGSSNDGVGLVLISPSRFARFAAREIARGL
jgi:hypothetical protein